MKIETLRDVSLFQLTETFNLAFADYLISLQLTEDQMLNKLKNENVQLNSSYGAFDGERLVGFILHGIDPLYSKDLAYNAGTGVIPSYRGKNLTGVIYEHAIQALKKKGIVTHQLEVMTNNEKAQRIYLKKGFKISRTIVCYKGIITPRHQASLDFQISSHIDLNQVSALWNAKPSWQNNIPSLRRMSGKLTVFSVYLNGALAAYCAFNKSNGRIYQLAVDTNYRKKGIASSLLQKVKTNSETKELSITNVDETDTESHSFLVNAGFVPFLKQFEMTLSS